MTSELSPEVLQAAREWIAECVWADLDEDDIEALSDEQVIRGIRRHYAGGVEQFIRDGV